MKILTILIGLLMISSAHAQSPAHSVDLTFLDNACTLTKTCTMQIYRGIGSCPPSGIGTLAYTQIAGSVVGTATNTTTTWTFNDPNLTPGSTYCYYATATFTATMDGPSGPSNTFQCTIPSPPSPGSLSGKVN